MPSEIWEVDPSIVQILEHRTNYPNMMDEVKLRIRIPEEIPIDPSNLPTRIRIDIGGEYRYLRIHSWKYHTIPQTGSRFRDGFGKVITEFLGSDTYIDVTGIVEEPPEELEESESSETSETVERFSYELNLETTEVMCKECRKILPFDWDFDDRDWESQDFHYDISDIAGIVTCKICYERVFHRKLHRDKVSVYHNKRKLRLRRR